MSPAVTAAAVDPNIIFMITGLFAIATVISAVVGIRRLISAEKK